MDAAGGRIMSRKQAKRARFYARERRGRRLNAQWRCVRPLMDFDLQDFTSLYMLDPLEERRCERLGLIP